MLTVAFKATKRRVNEEGGPRHGHDGELRRDRAEEHLQLAFSCLICAQKLKSSNSFGDRVVAHRTPWPS